MPRKKINRTTDSRSLRTNYDFKPFTTAENYNGIKSQTVPDEAMTIRDMLVKHRSGIAQFEKPVHFYEDEEDVPFHLRPEFDLDMITDAEEELRMTGREIEREKEGSEALGNEEERNTEVKNDAKHNDNGVDESQTKQAQGEAPEH